MHEHIYETTASAAKADLGLLCRYLGLPEKQGKHRCPFHSASDSNAFSIKEINGVFYWRCFGQCGMGGTIIDAIAHKESVDAIDVLRRFKGGGTLTQVPHSSTESATMSAFRWATLATNLSPAWSR